MKVTLTKEEVLSLDEGLKSLAKVQADLAFHYGISKNKRLVKPEIEILEEVSKPGNGFLTYEKERIKLVEKLAKKDEKGNPRIIKSPVFNAAGEITGSSSNYDIDENDTVFKTEINKLKKKHDPAIKEYEELMKGYAEMLKETVELDLHMIPLSKVPELPDDAFDKLFPLFLNDIGIMSAELMEVEEDETST